MFVDICLIENDFSDELCINILNRSDSTNSFVSTPCSFEHFELSRKIIIAIVDNQFIV